MVLIVSETFINLRSAQNWKTVRDQVIKPLMAGIIRRQGRPPKVVHAVDQHYQNLREELYKTFETLGLAVA